MVSYEGFYSNVSCGIRQNGNADGLITLVIEAEENAIPNRNWARQINNNSTFIMNIANKRQSEIARRKDMKISEAMRAILD